MSKISHALLYCLSFLLLGNTLFAQSGFSKKILEQSQLDFVNLGFGMFIHYGMPTFMEQDWSDPNAALELFKSPKLNADQWAKAAKSANMSYGCLTTKHHSGFPIWNTKTTDYNVMNTPLHRDVVKEFTDAFRKNGLRVMLYYSILDMHQGIRPHTITKAHIQLIKDQLTELLTQYGEIDALVIDGWDAPWSRISYDDVPFDDIYYLVKSLQPKCLLMDPIRQNTPVMRCFTPILNPMNKVRVNLFLRSITNCRQWPVFPYSKIGSGKHRFRTPQLKTSMNWSRNLSFRTTTRIATLCSM